MKLKDEDVLKLTRNYLEKRNGLPNNVSWDELWKGIHGSREKEFGSAAIIGEGSIGRALTDMIKEGEVFVITEHVYGTGEPALAFSLDTE